MVGLFDENKQEICKKLYELLKIAKGGNGLVSIEYMKDGKEEYAGLYWQNDLMKDHPNHKGFLQKICITGDSGTAIIQKVLEELFPDEVADETECANSDENEYELMDAVSSAARAAVNVYKRKLKDICLKKMVEFRLGEDQAEDLYSDIGKALLEELMKEDQKAV